MASPRRARLLLVDDLETNRFLLEETLSGMGLEIVCAESGERALAIFGALEPEVVLLDIQMPGLDGVETCRRMKQLAPSSYVVLVSGNLDAEGPDILARSHADRFLGKPYGLEDLRAAVSQGVRAARARHKAAT